MMVLSRYVIIWNILSVALLLMVGTKKKPLYFLLQAFEEKPKRCLMVCLIAIVETTPKLLTN